MPRLDRPAPSRTQTAVEVLLIFALFFLHAGWPPPAVNEAHYLAKAKHYWQPEWCAGDVFLESADVHLLFYWTVGALTKVFSLPVTAWIGRLVTWLLLATAWQRLSYRLAACPWMSVLTAAGFVLLTEHGHMAGEWVVGGIEAKSLSYVFVLLALAARVDGRWLWMGTCLGIATAFHVLVGGWSIVAASAAVVLDRQARPLRPLMVAALVCAAGVGLLGLLPALRQNWQLPPEVVREANRIYVYERLSHHLVFHRFPAAFMLRHAGLVLVWGSLAWTQRKIPTVRQVQAFVAAAVGLMLAGVIIDQATLYQPQLAAGLLRFYWFRLSDAMVPLGLALGLGSGLAGWRRTRPEAFAWGLITALILCTIPTGLRYWQRSQDLRPQAVQLGSGPLAEREQEQAFRDWLRVCAWLQQETRPDETLVSPRRQQTFKWYAQRPEFYSAKDVPQDARSLLEWWRRRELLYPHPADPRSADPETYWREVVAELRARDIRYWVVERGLPLPRPFVRVYPNQLQSNSHYTVYWLPQ